MSQSFSCVWLFTSPPLHSSPSGSSVHGIPQVRILVWVAISSSRGIFPTQGSNPDLLHFRQILYHLNHQGKIQCKIPEVEQPPEVEQIELCTWTSTIITKFPWGGANPGGQKDMPAPARHRNEKVRQKKQWMKRLTHLWKNESKWRCGHWYISWFMRLWGIRRLMDKTLYLEKNSQ